MSYATESELIAYAAARDVTILEAAATIVLLKAKDWMDVQPITFDTDEVPEGIKTVQMVAALLINSGVNLFESGSERITSENISGAVSTTFADVENYYKQLEALIAPFRTGSAGGNAFDLNRG